MNLKAWLFVALMSPACMAFAGRPLATEDADVLESGSCEWESFGAGSKPAGAPATQVLSTQFGCGVGYRSQVALARANSRTDGMTSPSWVLGGKTQILPRSDQATGLTLAWGAGWLASPGVSSRHEQTYLTLVATREVSEGLLAHANLGWSRSEQSAQDSTGWNLALEKSLAHGVDVMGEVYGTDRLRPSIGTGVRWTFREGLSVNASYGMQAETPPDAPRSKLWSVGFKWAF